MATLQEVETATLEMDAFEPALHVLGPCRARITISFDTAVNAEGALEISLTMRVQLRVRAVLEVAPGAVVLVIVSAPRGDDTPGRAPVGRGQAAAEQHARVARELRQARRTNEESARESGQLAEVAAGLLANEGFLEPDMRERVQEMQARAAAIRDLTVVRRRELEELEELEARVEAWGALLSAMGVGLLTGSDATADQRTGAGAA